MDEGGALVGKVDQSGPRKITASKSVRWPMGGGSGRRPQSGKHQDNQAIAKACNKINESCVGPMKT